MHTTIKLHQTGQIKAVIFDLDDTLWPILPVIRHAEDTLHEWMVQHAPVVAQQFSSARLRELRNALLLAEPSYQIDLWKLRHKVLSHAFALSDTDVKLVDTAMEVFSHARNAVTPFADVVPSLQRLATQHRLGSISNGFADLTQIGLAHHFSYSIAAHQSGCAKPDPAIFLGACEALGVLPAETVYVGDDLQLDVVGAQNAGLRAVWMKRSGIADNKQLPEHIVPDAVCATLTELETWLAMAGE